MPHARSTAARSRVGSAIGRISAPQRCPDAVRRLATKAHHAHPEQRDVFQMERLHEASDIDGLEAAAT
jgi:hypothetical protein